MAVVTIARQMGSGGDELARDVARELGVPYYDKEVIQLAATRLGITPEMAATEMQNRSLTNRLVSMLSLHPPADGEPAGDEEDASLGVRGITSSAYRDMLEVIMRELASTGSAVIVGRGSQVVLRDVPHAVHVFVTAPQANRLERVMRMRAVTHTEAERLIEASDQARASYLSTEYGAAWQSPELYGLVVNTGRCTTTMAVAAIVAAARAADMLRAPADDASTRRLRQEVYTVHEAASLLMLNPEILRHAIYGGELEALRVGNDLLLIQRRDLLAWFERQAAKTHG
ncbi:MAG: cytidylate kinase family protein [Chloroflexi bacterium]|nr:cytidylate kinase family protein [Chloroflexota bacterium]